MFSAFKKSIMTKFQISRTELLNGLQSVSKIISSKPILPIMANVQFVLVNGILTLTAADSNGQISTKFKVSSVDTVSICLEPKLLIEALRQLPEQPISLEINPDTFHTVIRYSGGKFEMKGLSPSEFPKEKKLDEAIKISLPAKVLLKGLDKTLFCAANDDLRPIMNGVYFEITKGKINFVASDAQKLALLEHNDESIDETLSFVLALKIASILKATLKVSDDMIDIFVEKNFAQINYKNDSVLAILVEGRFPNYSSVIPTNNDKRLYVGKMELKSAIDRVSVFAKKASSLVKLEVSNDELKLSAQDIDYSVAAEETIACVYSVHNIPLAIGFKGHFFTELISAIPTSEVQMSFSDPSRASLITPVDDESEDKLTYLLMPMMLSE